jgi:S1-C subfamily serine protease
MKVNRQRRGIAAIIAACLVLAVGVLVALLVSPPTPRPSVRAVGGPLPVASVSATRQVERREPPKDQERAAPAPGAKPVAPDAKAPPKGAAPGPAATPRGATSTEPSQAPSAPPAAPDRGAGGASGAQSLAKTIVRIEAKSGNEAKAMGSGFIVSVDGYAITNYSAVDAGGWKGLEIKLPGGESVKVTQLVGSDQERDLAVLAFEPRKGLAAVPLSHVDVKAGEKVTAVNTPTEIKGVRKLPDGTQVIEIAATISAASNGGPVFNATGQLVCVVVAKLRGAEGRFCVPVRDVIPMVEGLPGAQIASR